MGFGALGFRILGFRVYPKPKTLNPKPFRGQGVFLSGQRCISGIMTVVFC